MRSYCLATIVAVVLSSAAAAQAPAPAAPAVDAAAKLTPEEIKTLKARITSIDGEVRKEMTAYFRSLPGSLDPAGAAAGSVASGAAFTAKPVSENHRLLVAERNEIEARLLAAGEKIPQPRRNMTVRAPQQSAAFRAR